jgi:hypothetical protein
MLAESAINGINSEIPRGINLRRLGAKLALAGMLAAGLTVAATDPAWAQAAPAAVRSDADIQSDVAYALSHSKSLQGQHITAATVEGDVTLSGNVRDDASKELAESLLYRVNGVHSVTNNLIVGDAPQPAMASSGDANTTPEQDLNYDPAQQNMAPVGPQDGQAQAAPPPDQQSANQYPQPNDPQAANAQPRQPYSQQAYSQQQAYAPQPPAAPVTIPTGTLLQVRTSEPLDATKAQPGQLFQATVASDVYQGGVLALPRGAVLTGKVVAATTNKGDLAGKQGLSLALTSVNLGGQVYPLPTDTWSGQGPGKGGYSASNTVGGAGIGALIGAIAGGGAGAAIGAGVGGLVGAGASAATTGPRMYVPAEAVLNFHLTAPVTVTPVSAQEAQRLASSQPQLQRRGRYGYGPNGAYPPPPPPPGYYYPYRYPVAYYPYYYGYPR